MKTKKTMALAFAMAFAILPAAAACSETDNPAPTPKPEPAPTTHTYDVKFGSDNFVLATMDEASTLLASATVYCDKKATDLKATYTIKDTAIATVSETGEVRAVSAGKTEICASYTADDSTVTATAAVNVLSPVEADEVNAFSEDAVNLYGRTYTDKGKLVLDHVCTGIEVAFFGTKLIGSYTATNDKGGGKVRVYIDGNKEGEVLLLPRKTANTAVTFAENLEEGVHVVRILKASAPATSEVGGTISLADKNALSTDGTFLNAPKKSEFKIEVIGDSITEGYGSVGNAGEPLPTVQNSDGTKTYAYLAIQELDADFSIMALAGICVKDGITNSYNAYTQYSYKKITQYNPSAFDADIVILGLGENDMWHATSDQFPSYNVELLRKDYADMLRLIREHHPDAIIICAFGMMPAASTSQAKTLFEAAIADTGLDNIYSLPMIENTSGACSHPGLAGNKKNAEKLAAKIRELTEAKA